MRKYRGKYPTRIREVSCAGGRLTATTNDGRRWVINERLVHLPKLGEDISRYASAVAA